MTHPPPTQGEEETAQVLAKELFGLHYAARWPIIAAALRQRADEATEARTDGSRGPLEDENRRLREALEESLALNENFVSVSEDETLAHLSEHKAVIAQARAALRYAAPPASIIPCYRGGHNCSWPACSQDCDGRPGRASPPPPPQGEERGWAEIIRNDYDRAPDHFAATDTWIDGADDIAAKIEAALRQRADEATKAENERMCKKYGITE